MVPFLLCKVFLERIFNAEYDPYGTEVVKYHYGEQLLFISLLNYRANEAPHKQSRKNSAPKTEDRNSINYQIQLERCLDTPTLESVSYIAERNGR